MKIVDEPLPGVKLIQCDVYNDERGFFSERYTTEKFAELGIHNQFVQDNFSHSKAGVIRGLHYQKSPDQAKLVMVANGRILDVGVDLRQDSKTFGRHFAVELSAESGLMVFIPAGFAHGFCALTKADVLYKVDGIYNPAGENGLLYNDITLNIDWKIKNPIVSVKDLKLATWQQYEAEPIF